MSLHDGLCRSVYKASTTSIMVFNTQIIVALSELKDSAWCASLQMVYVAARTTATTAHLCEGPSFSCRLGQSWQNDLYITTGWSVIHW